MHLNEESTVDNSEAFRASFRDRMLQFMENIQPPETPSSAPPLSTDTLVFPLIQVHQASDIDAFVVTSFLADGALRHPTR